MENFSKAKKKLISGIYDSDVSDYVMKSFEKTKIDANLKELAKKKEVIQGQIKEAENMKKVFEDEKIDEEGIKDEVELDEITNLNVLLFGVEEEEKALRDETYDALSQISISEDEQKALDGFKELKDVMNKAGLMEYPSNYLKVGVWFYYNSNRLETMKNVNLAYQMKEKFDKTIIPAMEKEYKKVYKEYKDKGVPIDRCEKIARAMMKVREYERNESSKVSFPYLSEL
eukprot:gene12735-6927_t